VRLDIDDGTVEVEYLRGRDGRIDWLFTTVNAFIEGDGTGTNMRQHFSLERLADDDALRTGHRATGLQDGACTRCF